MAEFRLGRYRHFKGKLVEVFGIAKHSETLEEFVVYKELEGEGISGKGSLWARPKAMFLETVETGGKKVARFEFVGD